MVSSADSASIWRGNDEFTRGHMRLDFKRYLNQNTHTILLIPPDELLSTEKMLCVNS